VRERRDAGESLNEVIITIVVISLAVTALFAALNTATASAKSHADRAKNDAVVRDLAEAVKNSTATCEAGDPYTVQFTAPTGYSASITPSSGVCPEVTAVQIVTIEVTPPAGNPQRLEVAVRTP
jgi:Tfp pilus assembly protein PilV